jgi:predicted Zn-dependent protease
MLIPEQVAIQASQEAYAAELRPFAQRGRLDSDRALLRRVELIASRLVAQAVAMRPDTEAWNWSIRILDDPKQVNAWAMAGGRMGLYTGLVYRLEASDDELAQVLGHEIAHALARHGVEEMSMALASGAAVAALQKATGDARVTTTAAAAALVAIRLPNSREMEAEADRIGIELAARAGYDPRAAVTLWQKMGAVGGAAPPEFLSTHPNPAHRAKSLAALVPPMMPLYLDRTPRPVHPVNQRH